MPTSRTIIGTDQAKKKGDTGRRRLLIERDDLCDSSDRVAVYKNSTEYS